MDTVRIERSNTYSNLAVLLIVTELKPNLFPISQSLHYWFFSINISISVVAGNHLLNNLWDAKSFSLFFCTLPDLVGDMCQTCVNYSNMSHVCLHTNSPAWASSIEWFSFVFFYSLIQSFFLNRTCHKAGSKKACLDSSCVEKTALQQRNAMRKIQLITSWVDLKFTTNSGLC